MYDLADYLTLNAATADLRAEHPFEIVMTGYVDAISNFFTSTACEARRPPGTAWHVNLFQLIGGLATGCTMNTAADVDINVNTQLVTIIPPNIVIPCVSNTQHGEIDDCEVVLDILDRNLNFAASGDDLEEDYCDNGGLTCFN